MQIVKAVLILGKGGDKVVLFTTLPEPTFPYKDNMTMSFTTTKDEGEAYLKKHFPNIPYTIVERHKEHIPYAQQTQ